MNVISVGTFILVMILSGTVNAEDKIAILSFELNDITSLPNTRAERERTASIKPLLEQAIKQNSDYEIVQIATEQQREKNAGLGYLFKFHDVTAQLAKDYDADWVIVGQHSKPSFLFSYLIAYLINVETGKKVARFDIEMKGNHQKVTQRSVQKLSKEIEKSLLYRAKITLP